MRWFVLFWLNGDFVLLITQLKTIIFIVWSLCHISLFIQIRFIFLMRIIGFTNKLNITNKFNEEKMAYYKVKEFSCIEFYSSWWDILDAKTNLGSRLTLIAGEFWTTEICVKSKYRFIAGSSISIRRSSSGSFSYFAIISLYALNASVNLSRLPFSEWRKDHVLVSSVLLTCSSISYFSGSVYTIGFGMYSNNFYCWFERRRTFSLSISTSFLSI